MTQDMMMTLLSAVILLAPTIGLSWYYFSRVHDKKPAYYHKKVEKQLNRVAAIRKQKVLRDVTVSCAGKTGEFSHLLVGPFGVLAVTVLDKRGVYYGDAKSKTWYCDNGKTKFELPNPYLKTQKAIEALRELFSRNEIYKVPVEHIVVFDSYAKKSNCFVGSEIKRYRISQLNAYLEREEFEKDNGVDEVKIAALLSGENK